MTNPVVPTTEPNHKGSVNPETATPADLLVARRGPGRPPKPQAAANPTNTNYVPTAERNDTDQEYQPTGTRTRGIAGMGDLTFDESNLVDATETWQPIKVEGHLASLVPKELDSPAPISAPKPNEDLFPVRLLRNYVPMSDDWFPILNNGKIGKQPKREAGVSPKVMKGYKILLPLSEAKQVVARGLGERADALPD